MKRNTGFFAAIAIAVFTLFGVSTRPTQPGTSTTAESAQVTHAGNNATSGASVGNLRFPCRQINDQIAEFLPDKSRKPPESCREASGKPPGTLRGSPQKTQPVQLRYMIATLPNPVHTHFYLLFDRLTEALQQAAQDQGYNYDGSWLPWNDEVRSYGSLNDQQQAESLQEVQQSQPGVLVFRKTLPTSSEWRPCDKDPAKLCIPAPYSSGLIVFVVGENPTGGIHLAQFKNAVDWIRAISPQTLNGDLRILGPYFSGSFPSLAQALVANGLIDKTKPPLASYSEEQNKPGTATAAATAKPANSTSKDKQPTVARPAARKATAHQADLNPTQRMLTIFSGSTSSKAGIDWFSKFLENSPARFNSFQENDDTMIDRFCRYLRNLNYDTGRLAIISEDETAYGVFPSTTLSTAGSSSRRWLPNCDQGDHGPLYLYYPRDIAALRSAYQQASPSVSSSNATQELPIDLGETSSRQRDTIRTYGGKQTPLSQEATLFGITNLLRSHDTEFVVLRSSNSLDQVFLTRFLARVCPQARVVLTGADLLFRRSSETAGFRGTMTLTAYPLLTWQQDWTYWQKPESRHSHRAFPEDFAEGLYVAARFLIDSSYAYASVDAAANPVPVIAPKGSSVVVQDYAPPSWLLPTAPAVGSNQIALWPVEKGSLEGSAGRIATRPPTWLSVVGNEQLWPVAVLDESTVEGQRGDLIDVPPAEAKTQPPVTSTLPFVETGATYHYEPRPFILPLPMYLTCVFLLIWGCWHFFCCFFGSHASMIRSQRWGNFSVPSLRSLAYFAPVPRPQHKILIFLGCTVMAIFAVLIAAATGVLSFHLNSPLQHQDRNLLYCVLVFALAWAGLVGNYRTYLPKEWKYPSARNRHEIPKDCVSFQPRSEIKQVRKGPALRSMLLGGVLFLIVGLALVWMFRAILVAPLGRSNAIFALWRSINLFTGVSPLMPLLLLTAGLYGWFWYSLSGLALFNAGRPKLPGLSCLPLLPMCSRDDAGTRIEHTAMPLTRYYGLWLLGFGIPYALFWWLSGQADSIRALGPKPYARLYFYWLGLVFVLVLTEGWLMLRTWAHLRKLLLALDRLPLRRSLLALRGISWGTVWKMSGNVIEQRYRLLSRQKESLQHLENAIKAYREKHPKTAVQQFDGPVEKGTCEGTVTPLEKQFEECNKSGGTFDSWYAHHCGRRGREKTKPEDDATQRGQEPASPSDLSAILEFQEQLAATAGVVFLRVLQPAWKQETRSLILDPASGGEAKDSPPDKHPGEGRSLEPHVCAAEEFFCLPYLGFIQNILGRIRTMTFSITLLFIAATLSVSSYPFDPRPLLGGTLLALFAVTAAIIIFVYAEVHRDPTLSYITNTDPGKLGVDFWMKLITFGIGPLVGLLTALFPAITGFLTAWLQPSVQAIK